MKKAITLREKKAVLRQTMSQYRKRMNEAAFLSRRLNFNVASYIGGPFGFDSLRVIPIFSDDKNRAKCHVKRDMPKTFYKYCMSRGEVLGKISNYLAVDVSHAIDDIDCHWINSNMIGFRFKDKPFNQHRIILLVRKDKLSKGQLTKW